MACQPVRDLTSAYALARSSLLNIHSIACLTDVVLPHVVAVPDGLLSRLA